jgi:hypothetical protein
MNFEDKKYVFYYADDKKPAFYLIRYGDIINLSCNNEIVQRLSNILGDFIKNSQQCHVSVVNFNQHLKILLTGRDDKVSSHTENHSYLGIKYDYVYALILSKNFAKILDNSIQEFLKHTTISPSLYCLARQLNAIVRFQNRPPYADEQKEEDADEQKEEEME